MANRESKIRSITDVCVMFKPSSKRGHLRFQKGIVGRGHRNAVRDTVDGAPGLNIDGEALPGAVSDLPYELSTY